MKPSQATHRSVDIECPICRGELWVCEAHRFVAWSQCRCGEPGIPCDCNVEQRMPPGFEPICAVHDDP